MAISLSEKMIHRTIGAFVLIVFFISITPSFFHKSHLDINNQLDIAVTIPTPPPKPEIIIPKEPELQDIKPMSVELALPVNQPKMIIENNMRHIKKVSEPKPEEKKIVISDIKPANKKLFAVQIGAFKEKRNALNLMNSFKKQGFDSTVTVLINKKSHIPSYRVLVGKEHEKITAQTLQKKIAATMKIKGYIVYEELA